MQPTVALRRIELLRCNAWPKSNQPTALGKMLWNFPEGHSRGVVAATRPQLTPDPIGTPENVRAISLVPQLNFGFTQNKNSMAAFMNCLGRVYHIRNIKRTLCISYS
jgi:hypothetical protein